MEDEFGFIRKITPKQHHQESLQEGIGDDAAIWRPIKDSEQVVCLDTMTEGVHFTRRTMSPAQVGHKALAANLSDLAAMGAVPEFYLVSIAIPPSWNENELREIYEGMDSLALQYSVDLIGGDTVSTEGPLVVSVTVIGRVENGVRLLRKNARAGDVVFITGVLGESAAGLSLLLNNKLSDDVKPLLAAHQTPMPHIKEGRLLAGLKQRIALNDVSDGLASELHEIAEPSAVSIEIERDKLPVSEHLEKFNSEQQLNWMLYGGEDYKLAGTASLETFEAMKQQFEECDLQIFQIGRVTEKQSAFVYITDSNGKRALEKKGYNHFKK
ncbi:thiamine-phosphate kinase [Fictibacillus aquaticus]|uniref:Thiamine-monophosphate kinase n=1 Tax=Fictibacillus aquaticus TaxID=2021314 RepID=A0A235F528_9BACL|nr:thiamine-phosphate kinase [Fictibacillus aquaticus]OYD56406.1 thiamine-phosphate kinase [Fictibacillus aquaticus]